MTRSPARATLDARISEREFQQQVIALAELLRWTCYHTHDSRRSPAGFPDLVLARPPRLVFAELKSVRGRVSPAQAVWIALLGACPGVEMYLWRPGDFETICAVLR